VRVEREESEENNNTVVHKNTIQYVVNSLEIPGTMVLRQWVDIPKGEEEVSQLIPMLEQGLGALLNAGEEDDPDEGYFDAPLAGGAE
jgi:hypothetical protein